MNESMFMRPIAAAALLTLLGCSSENFTNAPAPRDASADVDASALDAGSDGATAPDAPATADGGSMFCSASNLDGGPSVYCQVGAQVCCVVETDSPNFCVRPGDSCATPVARSFPLACVSNANCAAYGIGLVCCATPSGLGDYISVDCLAPEQCATANRLQVCVTQGECKGDDTCTPVNELFRVCQ
jgi:hypothetical protein